MPKNYRWQLKRLKKISEDKINYIIIKAASQNSLEAAFIIVFV